MNRVFNIAIMATMAFSACSGSGSTSAINSGIRPPPFTGVPNSAQDTRTLAGIYDSSALFDDEFVINYLAIDNSGNGYSMEYQSECYTTTSGLNISNQGNGMYLVSSEGESGPAISLSASDERLVVVRGQETLNLPRVKGLNPRFTEACKPSIEIDIIGGAPFQFEGTQPGPKPPTWVIAASTSGGRAPVGSNQELAGNTDTSRIAGFWDGSFMDAGMLNSVYFLISEEGEFTEYDYLGDDFDQSQNCYSLSVSRISYLGNDRYFSESEFLVGEFVATVTNAQLSISDVSNGFSFSFPEAANFDNSIPNCN